MTKISRREAMRKLGVLASGVAAAAATSACSTTPSQSTANQTPKSKMAAKTAATGAKTTKPRFENPLTAITLGAGSRGNVYGSYASKWPEDLNIIGVAEPIVARNDAYTTKHTIADDMRFTTWEHVLAKPKMADMVIISMPDNLHHEPCIQAMRLGYGVLLEKPMAQTEEQCREILAVQQETGSVVGIAHVLRYAPYFIDMRDIVLAGKLGKVINMQHMEPIGFRHMLHSYVRGNWHNSIETTPIILGKSCHDLDIMRWILDEPCEQVSAFGDVSFYKRENAPKGSGERCLECAVEKDCAYSAKKGYLDDKEYVYGIMPIKPKDPAELEKAIIHSLKTTNYGRCAFKMENDQPEHLACNMIYKSGTTATFNMDGFTHFHGRRTKIMGTKGSLIGDMKTFTYTDFLTKESFTWDITKDGAKGSENDGHGGGDHRFASDLLNAIYTQDESLLTSTVAASVESHITGFRIEKSRKGGGVQRVDV